MFGVLVDKNMEIHSEECLGKDTGKMVTHKPRGVFRKKPHCLQPNLGFPHSKGETRFWFEHEHCRLQAHSVSTVAPSNVNGYLLSSVLSNSPVMV